MKIENRFWELMAERSLTIKDVHKGTGLNRNTLSNIKNHRTADIKLSTLGVLCDYFQIMPGDFYKVEEI